MKNHTVQAIRYRKLQQLLGECLGNQAELARRAATNPAYISQILNNTKMPSGKPRSVGERLARKLEQAFDKPEGWMDSSADHRVAEPRPHYGGNSAKVQKIVELGRELPQKQLQVAIDQLKQLADSE